MRSFQILLVEDFEAFRRLVCRTLLQRAEFRVVEASDGLEALQKAEYLQPDLILLDVGLPNLNGIEVSKCVGKLAPAAKVLFLSLESSPDVVRGALSIGARGYIQKLYVQSELLPAIDAVLSGECFVSSGLPDLAPPNGHKSKEPKYIWQQTVIEALQASPDCMPIRISAAQRAIAARLRDPSQTDLDELLALRSALRSLAILIDEARSDSAGSA